MEKVSGQLSNIDIINECGKEDSLQIRPFIPSHLKSASYDITPSIIAMSSKLGMLETVYREPTFPFRHYILVSPKDSILAVSNEYVRLPSHIAGYVVSRVSKVVEGFGHISTSIDPGWCGALLIALSNPSNKTIKVYVGTSLHDTIPNNPLATVIFHYLNSSANIEKTDLYRGMRMDLLEKVCYTKRTGIRAYIQKIAHPKRKAFTDYFFEYCKTYASMQNLKDWGKFIDTFSGRPERLASGDRSADPRSPRHRRQVNPYDFIICETVWARFIYWCKNHSYLFRWAVVIAFLALTLSGHLRQEVFNQVTEILNLCRR